jgi:hypothetical protein
MGTRAHFVELPGLREHVQPSRPIQHKENFLQQGEGETMRWPVRVNRALFIGTSGRVSTRLLDRVSARVSARV